MILSTIAGAIFVGALIWCAVLIFKPHGDTVYIKQDGEVIYNLDLSKETDRKFDIEYNGSRNTVEIKDGKIRICEADCPDRVCVHTGWLTSDIPIVCLPNRLVIEYADGASDADSELAPDAVAR
ncbi:MAG: NusG domain II-containing protein [Ruminococcus sp.]|nr:NusG domain II-containing protein [Ruminococcus sp.]